MGCPSRLYFYFLFHFLFSFPFFLKFIYFVYVNVFSWMYVCLSHICSIYRGQERAPDLLKLQLTIAVSCHMEVLGIEPGCSGREVSALNLGAIAPALSLKNKTKTKNNAFYFITVSWLHSSPSHLPAQSTLCSFFIFPHQVQFTLPK